MSALQLAIPGKLYLACTSLKAILATPNFFIIHLYIFLFYEWDWLQLVVIGAGLRHDQSESNMEITWLLGPTSCNKHEYIVVTTSFKVN